MARLVWDQADNRYEAGVDRGVFYPPNGPGEVWNGLTSVQESPSDADERTRYIDGRRTRTGRRPGDFAGVIEAFTYPEKFQEVALIPRIPKPFGLSYRTKTEKSYKIHIVYNVLVAPTEHLYEQDDAVPFSWDFTTKPVAVPRGRPSAHMVIDAGEAYSSAIAELEELLYGSESVETRLPSPAELFDIFERNAILRIIDHGDGSWTAIGPDDVISVFEDGSFTINYPTATWISSDTYTIHSW